MYGLSLSVFYAGVSHKIPGNGGPDCVNYLPIWQRAVETLAIAVMSCLEIGLAIKNIRPVRKICCEESPVVQHYRKLALVLLCLAFGTELGYKFATETSIYLLNPCHLTTILQIYLLLSAPSSPTALAVFRFQIYSLSGATLALIFPVLNTRLLPLEICIYYVQHIVLLLIPIFLMAVGGAYTVEPFFEWSWGFLSLGILFLYHFLPLQLIGMVTEVNLNNVICPAVSDPFEGRFYRVFAVGHQTLYVIAHGKLYAVAVKALLKVYHHYCPESPVPVTVSMNGHHYDSAGDCSRPPCAHID